MLLIVVMMHLPLLALLYDIASSVP
jgi:hypothetical protein